MFVLSFLLIELAEESLQPLHRAQLLFSGTKLLFAHSLNNVRSKFVLIISVILVSSSNFKAMVATQIKYDS